MSGLTILLVYITVSEVVFLLDVYVTISISALVNFTFHLFMVIKNGIQHLRLVPFHQIILALDTTMQRFSDLDNVVSLDIYTTYRLLNKGTCDTSILRKQYSTNDI